MGLQHRAEQPLKDDPAPGLHPPIRMATFKLLVSPLAPQAACSLSMLRAQDSLVVCCPCSLPYLRTFAHPISCRLSNTVCVDHMIAVTPARFVNRKRTSTCSRPSCLSSLWARSCEKLLAFFSNLTATASIQFVMLLLWGVAFDMSLTTRRQAFVTQILEIFNLCSSPFMCPARCQSGWRHRPGQSVAWDGMIL